MVRSEQEADCRCTKDCEFPCWQRVGVSRKPCSACGCAHHPALDPEDWKRLERIATTIEEGGELLESTPTFLRRIAGNLASHQGGGEELKAVRDFADERRDELNAARSSLDRSDQRYEANAGEARAFGSVVAFIDTLGPSCQGGGKTPAIYDASGKRLTVGCEVEVDGLANTTVEEFEWLQPGGWHVAVSGCDREGAVGDSFPTVPGAEPGTYTAVGVALRASHPEGQVE